MTTTTMIATKAQRTRRGSVKERPIARFEPKPDTHCDFQHHDTSRRRSQRESALKAWRDRLESMVRDNLARADRTSQTMKIRQTHDETSGCCGDWRRNCRSCHGLSDHAAVSRPARHRYWRRKPELAHHQTGHNSGVLHTGIYYKPGSLKAINCRAGKKAMEEFCAAEGIPYEICGKVIVAVDDSELPALERIFERGQANGVNCAKIDKDRLAELEPHAAGVACDPRSRGGHRQLSRGLPAAGRARARTRRRGAHVDAGSRASARTATESSSRPPPAKSRLARSSTAPACIATGSRR